VLSKQEIYEIGFETLGGAIGMLLVGFFLPGDLGLVLRNAGLLGLPVCLCILVAGALLRHQSRARSRSWSSTEVRQLATLKGTSLYGRRHFRVSHHSLRASGRDSLS
jgi:hypothetical protein